MRIQMPTLNMPTPTLKVIDGRGLPVRQIAYWREAVETEARITAQHHDAAGRLVAQHDPRLITDASAPANLTTLYSLSGQVLSTLSVDAGWRVNLLGEASQSVLSRDSRGSQRSLEYDEQVRPLALFEQALDGEPLCTERYAYGSGDPAFATRNQCGQLIRHDDSAGTQLFAEFGLQGGVLAQTRHFLRALDAPDWPETLTERDKLLETGTGTGANSRSVFNPLGEAIEQTDAEGNRQFFSQTCAGQLREVQLQLDKDTAPKTLVSAIQFNAHGQTEQETAGNGVVTQLEYAAEDGRLTRLQAKRGNDVLQDLRYAYDPVGNVLSIEDAALPIRYFANQRIEPVIRYGYDSLYQLIKAMGCEAGGPNQGPLFSVFDDPAACANFTQTYRYDRGGNLLELTHEGPQQHGHRLLAAAQSNRCLPVIDGVEPDEKDFRNSFDANGNLLILQPGQSLHWDLRNQLREVQTVARAFAIGDSERYVYGADGMRLRKIRSTQSNARTLVTEVRYLPNLEIRTHSGTGEILHVISVQAGRSSVQVLHWESEPPKDITNDQQRYSLSDHLGSCTLELDSAGQVISHERYHPFGTTAWFAGRGEVEASYKTLRYSGKERDCTGLYYYGFRYYVACLQRWLNPDPAGVVDGLNQYRFVKSNPSSGYDFQGLLYQGANDSTEELAKNLRSGFTVKYRGNTEALKAGEDTLIQTNDAAWALSAKLVESAINNLESGDLGKFSQFLRGKDTAENIDFALKRSAQFSLRTYKEILKEIPRYQQGGDLRDQIVYLEGKTGETPPTAFVRKDDSLRRIFVTDLFRSNNVIGRARTFIHELSHLVANTEDRFGYSAIEFSNDPSGTKTKQLIKFLTTNIQVVHTTVRNDANVTGAFEFYQTSNADTLAIFPLLMLNDAEIATSAQQSVDPYIKRNDIPGIRM